MRTNSKIANYNLIPANGVHKDAALELELAKRHAAGLIEAREWGIQLWVTNAIVQGTTLASIVEKIRGTYNIINSYAHLQNESTLNIVIGKLDVDELEKKNAAIEIAVKNKQNEVNIEQDKIKDLIVPKYPTERIALFIFLSVCVITGDMIMLSQAFQSTGAGLVLSMVLGLVMTITLAATSILGMVHYEKVSSPKMQLLVAFGINALVAVTVFTLSDMRLAFFHSQHTGYHISSFRLAMMALLAFVCLELLVKYIYLPTRGIIAQRKVVIELLQKFDRLVTELHKLIAEYNANEHTIKLVKQYRSSLLAKGISMEQLVVAYYNDSIAVVKNTYIEKTGMIWECFNHPAPPLTLFFSEINIMPKLNHYES